VPLLDLTRRDGSRLGPPVVRLIDVAERIDHHLHGVRGHDGVVVPLFDDQEIIPLGEPIDRHLGIASHGIVDEIEATAGDVEEVDHQVGRRARHRGGDNRRNALDRERHPIHVVRHMNCPLHGNQ
jgi:hypothetical protein